MSAAYLDTARLTLRRFTAEDADLLVDLDADAAVMRYINGGRPTSRTEIVDEVLPAWLSYYQRYSDYGFFAANRRLESGPGEFVGWFHLRPGKDAGEDEPELGYRLRRSTWRQGLASEGSRALVEHAFAVAGARRVNAETMSVNVGSRGVMLRAGLHQVRTFHADWPESIPGDEHGEVEYALERGAWISGRIDVLNDVLGRLRLTVQALSDAEFGCAATAHDDVRGLLRHLVGWQQVFLACANDQPPHLGDGTPRVETDGRALVVDLARSSADLVAALRERGDRDVDLPYRGTTPMAGHVAELIAESVLHTWDLATALDQRIDVGDDVLVAAHAGLSRMLVAGLPESAFGASSTSSYGDELDRLVARSGRHRGQRGTPVSR